MILVQMYNIFRLLLGVPGYSIVVSRMEENKNSASLSFIGACCVVDESVRVWGMLDPNLARTCASEALGRVSFCSFSTNCRVN